MNAFIPTDGYKVDHRRQYPEGTELVFSNLTARSSKLSNLPESAHNNETVFFGLSQFIDRFLLEFWNEGFFNRPVEEVVGEYTRHINMYLGPNNIGDEHIRELHAYGRLPITIRAVPEGTSVPIQVPYMTFHNTPGRPEFFWVTNYLETLISAEMWKPITSATTAKAYRTLIKEYCEKTGGSLDFVDFQGHDFSFRGMSGYWDACVSGTAHLTSFLGTDTVPALAFAEKYYRGSESPILGVSVPASEHSVMCMGTQDDEIGTFRRFINDLYPTGVVSIVSDTWDFWKVITEFSVELKDEIMKRAGKTVFRPDSGDPVRIVCGYNWDGVDYEDEKAAKAAAQSHLLDFVLPNGEEGDFQYGELYQVIKIKGKFYAFEVYDAYFLGSGSYEAVIKEELTEHEVKGAVECLWDIFGGTVTPKGYRTLDQHVGLIYGDSITYERCEAILKGLEMKGFSSDNVVFGIGSFTYQYVTRDTYGMAVKATFGIVNGEERQIFKDPKTGSSKKSAKGITVVSNYGGHLTLLDQLDWESYIQYIGSPGDAFETVFLDGVKQISPSLEEIRKRVGGPVIEVIMA